MKKYGEIVQENKKKVRGIKNVKNMYGGGGGNTGGKNTGKSKKNTGKYKKKIREKKYGENFMGKKSTGKKR